MFEKLSRTWLARSIVDPLQNEGRGYLDSIEWYFVQGWEMYFDKIGYKSL